MPKSKVQTRTKKRLPIIRCECGAEILMVPDLKGMSEAIEAHAEKHAKEAENPVEAEVIADRIRENLIGQVFKKASITTR